ncbi:LCP family protein [Actinomadura chibensis]|uniref:LytR family transcriptional regulator n=1 Tax=Actinomadura chibensis TaxID=392828 RepID=A0A5D0NBM2_9ACTN|nr:LCP family protein [Actinomadura chibensis]TYB41717.1 LytR family transcriptional regulator [Actinomadura chibensis]
MGEGGPGGGRARTPPRPARGGAGADATPRGLAEALLIAAVAPALPGLAQLRAGRIRLGSALVGGQALLLTCAALAAGRGRPLVAELSARPGWLLGLAAGSVAVAGLWAALIVHSYAVLAPAGLSPLWRLAGGTTVSVLCLLVIVPPVTLAQDGYLQRDLVTSLFAEGRDAPWAGAPRLDVLLVADADADRHGVRTGDMTVASIDTRTGGTVLLGLPRDLRRVPVWSGAGRVPFPPEGPLDAVYRYGAGHPGVLAGGGRVRDPGAELLKRTVGHILGRPVPYYAMFDMTGFRQIVDAVGGIGPARAAGGAPARMARQTCLLRALARQAGPRAVLGAFERLARILRDSVSTDLPRRPLPPLLALAAKIKDAQISGLRLAAPLVSPRRPDYPEIRRIAAETLRMPAPGSRDTPRMHILSNACT